MREKTRAAIAQHAAPFLEGETMRAAAPCFEGPRAALLFGLIGLLFVKQRLVVVTDRHVYLLSASRWSLKRATGVEAKHALGSVEVVAERKLPFTSLRVGDRQLWVGKVYGGDAEEVARAASGAA